MRCVARIAVRKRVAPDDRSRSDVRGAACRPADSRSHPEPVKRPFRRSSVCGRSVRSSFDSDSGLGSVMRIHVSLIFRSAGGRSVDSPALARFRPDFASGLPNVVASRPLIKALQGRIRRRCTSRTWRVVAICFLAFTAYELCLAGTCGPELLGFPPDVAAHAVGPGTVQRVSESTAMSPATEESRHDHSDEAGCSTEDCFCYCAHIRVAGVYVVSILDDPATTVTAHHVSLPSGSSACLFRPPRII